MTRMSEWFVLAAIASAAMPAVAVEVSHAEGVEIISGRPAQATSAPSPGTASRTSESVSAHLDPHATWPETTERYDALDDASAATGSSSGSVTSERLRAAETVLHDQIDAYNQALIEGASREVLKPLEAAIGRTLEHIEKLLRTANQHES